MKARIPGANNQSRTAMLQQVQKAQEIVRKNAEVIVRFHKECEALIVSLDELCRPELNQDTDVKQVGEVARLIDEIVHEMSAASATLTIKVNGISYGDAGSISAEASTRAKVIQQYWSVRYKQMPGYAADQSRIQEENKKKKENELRFFEEDVLYELKKGEWIKFDDLKNLLNVSPQKLSAALRSLMNNGEIERMETRQSAYFALKGTPLPQKEEKNLETKNVSKEPDVSEILPEPEPKNQKKSKAIIAVIVSVLVVAVLAVAAILLVNEHNNRLAAQEEQRIAEQLLFCEQALEKIKQGIAGENPDNLVLSAEEKDALKEQGIADVFKTTVIREAIAERFSELYRGRDMDGTIKFWSFIRLNSLFDVFDTYNGNIFDICFSDEYLDWFEGYIKENGTYIETNLFGLDIYSYKGYELGFSYNKEGCLETHVYIKIMYEDSVDYTYVNFGDYSYRFYIYKEAKKTSPGYFSVGEEVELVFDELEVAIGNCHRCSGTGKVTGHFGVGWNDKPGYIYGEKCGACNGTGWK